MTTIFERWGTVDLSYHCPGETVFRPQDRYRKCREVRGHSELRRYYWEYGETKIGRVHQREYGRKENAQRGKPKKKKKKKKPKKQKNPEICWGSSYDIQQSIDDHAYIPGNLHTYQRTTQRLEGIVLNAHIRSGIVAVSTSNWTAL